ncbi:hypothetical protein K9L67_01565 [Candidatus Woesearchaeota archaeon]|nr:hypothetical protein [Candidatus Woesearchaeota archaeon]MCF7900891.1 hypothetical protein [Candidatus Woesearchaeota archaeon]MCF8013060.1 hypothetical protein [Candidatus Woesearchaeota archaeon]
MLLGNKAQQIKEYLSNYPEELKDKRQKKLEQLLLIFKQYQFEFLKNNYNIPGMPENETHMYLWLNLIPDLNNKINLIETIKQKNPKIKKTIKILEDTYILMKYTTRKYIKTTKEYSKIKSVKIRQNILDLTPFNNYNESDKTISLHHIITKENEINKNEEKTEFYYLKNNKQTTITLEKPINIKDNKDSAIILINELNNLVKKEIGLFYKFDKINI